MAGSPGAGKTEFSKNFINILVKKEPSRKVVRIDPDEIRAWFPEYNPKRSELYQSAVSLGVDVLIQNIMLTIFLKLSIIPMLLKRY
jgi:UDP-N-acetylglucosamine kinase